MQFLYFFINEEIQDKRKTFYKEQGGRGIRNPPPQLKNKKKNTNECINKHKLNKKKV